MTRRGCLAAITCAVLAVTVQAQSPPRAFVTRHTGTFNGQRISYTATVGETVIADDKGTTAASFFSIAYVADSKERNRRPIIFAFNGGPGSASVFLHMGALGPKRVALPADVKADVVPPYRAIDNTYSPLDVADLVLIDPVETGYSRVLAGGNRQSFYNAANDAKSVAQFIQAWVKATGRESSRKFIVGESYGTIRAVLVAEELAKVGDPFALTGVALLGQALNIVETVQRAGSVIGQAVNLQCLAAIGFYHGRADTKGRTLEQHLDDAYAFAMGDYLTALVKGRDLPAEERTRIAQRLSELTGLSADDYGRRDLMITKDRFREEILKDKGVIVGRYDARYTGPASVGGKPAPDPSMKMSPAFDALVKEHLSQTLGVTMTDEYRLSDRAAGAQWDYGGARSPFTDYDYSGAFARVMRSQPNLHLLIGTGIYDTTTTIGAARYFVARNAFPEDRVVSRTYEGGHMFYTNESALKTFSDDLRAFIAPPALR